MLGEGDSVAARKKDRRIPERVEAMTKAIGVPTEQPGGEQRIAEVAGQRAAEVKDERKGRNQRQAGKREENERGFPGFGPHIWWPIVARERFVPNPRIHLSDT